MTRWKKLILAGFTALIVALSSGGASASPWLQLLPEEQKQLQEVLDDARLDAGAAGAVLLIQSASVQWVGSSGLANVKANTAMRPEDRLRIASMTKTFVAAVFLRLSQEGALDLDSKIKNHLPARFVGRIAHGSEITIRQLLNMTSGIYNYTQSDAYNDAVERQPYRSPWTPAEILETVSLQEAVFAPGEGFDYSNTNYILLDMIVKAVSGRSLAAEMRRIIHVPLGLSGGLSGISMEIQEPGQAGFGGLLVRGYEEDGEDITEIQDGLGLGDGGLISNAQGVAGFLQALFVDKTLLNTGSLDQMRAFHPIEDYGLGLERRMTKYGEAWGHSGGSSGFQGEMLFMPEVGVIFVLLTNTLDTDIFDMVFQESMEAFLYAH